MGRYDVHVTEEVSCRRASPLYQLIGLKRGDVLSPLCFWEKKEYPPGKGDKEGFCSRSGCGWAEHVPGTASC